MEHAISEVFKYFTSMVLILLLVGVGLFCKDMAQISSFKNYVNTQIERNGGYTAAAKSNIEKKSLNDFNNQYKVRKFNTEEPLPVKSLSFGESVTYTIHADLTIPFTFGNRWVIPIEATGESVSKVRGGEGT